MRHICRSTYYTRGTGLETVVYHIVQQVFVSGKDHRSSMVQISQYITVQREGRWLGLDGLFFLFHLLFYCTILEIFTYYSSQSTYYSSHLTYYSKLCSVKTVQ